MTQNRPESTPTSPAQPRDPAQRRDYMTHDHKYIQAHYPHQSAAETAAALGRTRGSVYEYIARHPELRKRGRI